MMSSVAHDSSKRDNVFGKTWKELTHGGLENNFSSLGTSSDKAFVFVDRLKVGGLTHRDFTSTAAPISRSRSTPFVQRFLPRLANGFVRRSVRPVLRG